MTVSERKKIEKVMCTYDCEQCNAVFQDELYPDDPDNTIYCPACRMNFVCSFCYEKDFDKVGLKVHLQNYCQRFDEIDIHERVNKILIGK